MAINTISLNVVDSDGQQCFPGAGRKPAGISGAAIKQRAQEVARNLVKIRNESEDYRFNILAVGGALDRQDVCEYLDIGADVVECATGAFLNPNLGLEVRLDQQKLSIGAARMLMTMDTRVVGEKAYVEAGKIVANPALHMGLTLIGRGQIADPDSLTAIVNNLLQESNQSSLTLIQVQEALRRLQSRGYVQTKGRAYTLTSYGEEVASVLAGVASASS